MHGIAYKGVRITARLNKYSKFVAVISCMASISPNIESDKLLKIDNGAYINVTFLCQL